MLESGLIKYTLIRSQRKTLILQIDKKGQLLARAPMQLSIKKIKNFISQKQYWINKKQQLTQAKLTIKASYRPGDKFLYLGQSYPLKLIGTGDPLLFNGQFFYLNIKYDGSLAFHWFYKKEFIKIAIPILKNYTKQYHLHHGQVKFKAQKTRWGSCSSKNNINLNYLLIMAPIFVINTIIAHELSHIKHKNHSKDFYTLLKMMVTDYKKTDVWLKNHGYKLHCL